MSSAAGTLESVAIELSKILSPLARDLSTPDGTKGFLLQLGFVLTDPQLATCAGDLSRVANDTTALVSIIPRLIGAIEAEDVLTITTLSVEAIHDIAEIVSALAGLGGGLAAFATLSSAEIARRMFDYLIFEYLDSTKEVNQILELLGLLDREEHEEDPNDPSKPAYTIVRYNFDGIGEWLTDPAKKAEDLYDWRKNGFDGKKLFARIERVLANAGLPVLYDDTSTPPRLDLVIVEAVPKTDVTPHGILIRIKSTLAPDAQTISLGPDARMELKVELTLPKNVGLFMLPDWTLGFQPPSPASTISGELGLKVIAEKTQPPEPFILFGQAGKSRLELAKFAVDMGTRVTWDGSVANGEFRIGAALEHMKVVIDTTEGDGFLGKILPGTKIEADVSLEMGISTEHGFYFNGSSALEVQLPVHIDLGIIALEAMTLSARLSNAELPISIGANIRAGLGPLVAVVENIGITTKISFAQNNNGNLGPIQFGIGFKPPNGVGLSLDTGVVKGGGYLFIDTDRGEYAGALELAFFQIVTVKAVGLITTKMPDGSKGFSLLIIMSVEFGTGIQLGFGFTLLAVGGLLGLNRTMNLTALAEGIRSGAIESVMFPRDIVANAPKIISDLRALFPPEEGKFLIGPMVKLGWGTPTLVSLSLGIIIEIPGNIAIVGILQVALPTADAPLIKLQVNFIGAIEFDKKRIWFFAALFDSRVLFLTIEGEMGVLAAFGDDANFVVSVGGFHPRFSPPPLPFPSPRRIAINILNTPVARIRVEGYFAVTSNTAQFGAGVEVYFGFSALNVQGHLAFDALFQFSPFYFIIEISATFSVNVIGLSLLSARLHGQLEGPAPWHIEGHGSISILFWDIDVDFSTTWGEDRKEELPPIKVMELLTTELQKPEAFRAFLLPGTDLRVSVRKMPEAEAALILHPVGVLRISQRAVPLELTITKVGSRKPEDVNRLTLVVTGGGLQKKEDAFDKFAPAQYQDFSDADKVSKPAFASEKCGLHASSAGPDLASSKMVRRVVRYEEILLDSNYKRFHRRFHLFLGALFQFFLKGNAAAMCDVSMATKKKLQPFDDKIEVKGETYTVAFQANNKAFHPEAAAFHSEASARDYLDRKTLEDPTLADKIHVIPSFERAA